jgi:hypothetical protein
VELTAVWNGNSGLRGMGVVATFNYSTTYRKKNPPSTGPNIRSIFSHFDAWKCFVGAAA